jgi:hypothetical protein
MYKGIKMSFKPVIKTRQDKDWVRNGQVFATASEAMSTARNLEARWTAVTDIDVIESDEPVNYKWTDGVGVEHI